MFDSNYDILEKAKLWRQGKDQWVMGKEGISRQCVCVCVCVCVQSLSHVRFFATLWTVAHQAPLFMGFSRQEYWCGVPFPSPGDLPDPGIKPESLRSPVLAGSSSAIWAHRVFKIVKILYTILLWRLYVIIYLSKPTEYMAPTVNPNVKYGLWMTEMCLCKFISCNKLSTPGGYS